MILSDLTKSERRVYAGVAVMIVAFLVAAFRGYGLFTLWLAVFAVPVLFVAVLIVVLARGER